MEKLHNTALLDGAPKHEKKHSDHDELHEKDAQEAENSAAAVSATKLTEYRCANSNNSNSLECKPQELPNLELTANKTESGKTTPEPHSLSLNLTAESSSTLSRQASGQDHQEHIAPLTLVANQGQAKQEPAPTNNKTDEKSNLQITNQKTTDASPQTQNATGSLNARGTESLVATATTAKDAGVALSGKNQESVPPAVANKTQDIPSGKQGSEVTSTGKGAEVAAPMSGMKLTEAPGAKFTNDAAAPNLKPANDASGSNTRITNDAANTAGAKSHADLSAPNLKATAEANNLSGINKLTAETSTAAGPNKFNDTLPTITFTKGQEAGSAANTIAQGKQIEPASNEKAGTALTALTAQTQSKQGEASYLPIQNNQTRALALDNTGTSTGNANTAPVDTNIAAKGKEGVKTAEVHPSLNNTQLPGQAAANTRDGSTPNSIPALGKPTEALNNISSAKLTETPGAKFANDATNTAGAKLPADVQNIAGAKFANVSANTAEAKLANAPANTADTKIPGAPANTADTKIPGAPANTADTKIVNAPANAADAKIPGDLSAPNLKATAEASNLSGINKLTTETSTAVGPNKFNDTLPTITFTKGQAAEAINNISSTKPTETPVTKIANIPANAADAKIANAPANPVDTKIANLPANPADAKIVTAPANAADTKIVNLPANIADLSAPNLKANAEASNLSGINKLTAETSTAVGANKFSDTLPAITFTKGQEAGGAANTIAQGKQIEPASNEKAGTALTAQTQSKQGEASYLPIQNNQTRALALDNTGTSTGNANTAPVDTNIAAKGKEGVKTAEVHPSLNNTQLSGQAAANTRDGSTPNPQPALGKPTEALNNISSAKLAETLNNISSAKLAETPGAKIANDANNTAGAKTPTDVQNIAGAKFANVSANTADAKLANAPANAADIKIVNAPATPADTKIANLPANAADAKIANAPANPVDTKIANLPANAADTKIINAPANAVDTKIVNAPANAADTKIVNVPANIADGKLANTPANTVDTKIPGDLSAPNLKATAEASNLSGINKLTAETSTAVGPNKFNDTLPTITFTKGQAAEAINNISSTKPTETTVTKIANIPANSADTKIVNAPANPADAKIVNAPATPADTKIANLPANAADTKIVNVPANAAETKIVNAPANAADTKIVNAPANAADTKIVNAPANAADTKIPGDLSAPNLKANAEASNLSGINKLTAETSTAAGPNKFSDTLPTITFTKGQEAGGAANTIAQGKPIEPASNEKAGTALTALTAQTQSKQGEASYLPIQNNQTRALALDNAGTSTGNANTAPVDTNIAAKGKESIKLSETNHSSLSNTQITGQTAASIRDGSVPNPISALGKPAEALNNSSSSKLTETTGAKIANDATNTAGAKLPADLSATNTKIASTPFNTADTKIPVTPANNTDTKTAVPPANNAETKIAVTPANNTDTKIAADTSAPNLKANAEASNLSGINKLTTDTSTTAGPNKFNDTLPTITFTKGQETGGATSTTSQGKQMDFAPVQPGTTVGQINFNQATKIDLNSNERTGTALSGQTPNKQGEASYLPLQNNQTKTSGLDNASSSTTNSSQSDTTIVGRSRESIRPTEVNHDSPAKADINQATASTREGSSQAPLTGAGSNFTKGTETLATVPNRINETVASNANKSFEPAATIIPNRTSETITPSSTAKSFETPTTTLSVSKGQEPIAAVRSPETITITSSQSARPNDQTHSNTFSHSTSESTLPTEKSTDRSSTNLSNTAAVTAPVRAGENNTAHTTTVTSSVLKGSESIAHPSPFSSDRTQETHITKAPSITTEIKPTDAGKIISTPGIHENSAQIKAAETSFSSNNSSRLTMNVATQAEKTDNHANNIKTTETVTSAARPTETTISTAVNNVLTPTRNTESLTITSGTPSGNRDQATHAPTAVQTGESTKSEPTSLTTRPGTTKIHLQQEEKPNKSEPQNTHPHHGPVNNYVPTRRESEDKAPQSTPSEEISLPSSAKFGNFAGSAGNSNNNNQDPNNQASPPQVSAPVTIDIPLPNLIIVGDEDASKRHDATNSDGKIATQLPPGTASTGGWPLSPINSTEKSSGKKDNTSREDDLSIAIKAFLDKTQKQVNQTQSNRYDPEKTSKYKIEEGETLASIAENLFGDPKLAALIYQINSGLWQSSKRDGKVQLVFSPGITIFLPTRKEIAEYRKSTKNKNTQFEYFIPQSPSSLRGILSARRAQAIPQQNQDNCATVVVTAPPHKAATERLATLKNIGSVSRSFSTNTGKDFKDLEERSRFTEEEIEGNYRAKVECLFEGEWKVVVEYIVGEKAFINSYNLSGKVREIHLDLPQEIVKPMAINDLEKNRLAYCKKYLQGLKLFC